MTAGPRVDSVGFAIETSRDHAAVQRGPDGTWHDGLLLDLVADELT